MRASMFKKYDPQAKGKSVTVEGIENKEPDAATKNAIIEYVDREMAELSINGKSMLDHRREEVLTPVQRKMAGNYEDANDFTVKNNSMLISKNIEALMKEHLKELNISDKDQRTVESILASKDNPEEMRSKFLAYRNSLINDTNRFHFSVDKNSFASLVNLLSRRLFGTIKTIEERNLLANTVASGFAKGGLMHVAQDHFDNRIQDNLTSELSKKTFIGMDDVSIVHNENTALNNNPDLTWPEGVYVTRKSMEDPWRIILIDLEKEQVIHIHDEAILKKLPNKLPDALTPKEQNNIKSLAFELANKESVAKISHDTEHEIAYEDKTGKVTIREKIKYNSVELESATFPKDKEKREAACNVDVESSISIQLKKPTFKSNAPSKMILTVESVKVNTNNDSPGSEAVAKTFDLRSALQKILDRISAIFSRNSLKVTQGHTTETAVSSESGQNSPARRSSLGS